MQNTTHTPAIVYTYAKIKDEADQLLILHDYKSLSKFPLPIEKIAEGLGYTVKTFEQDRNTKDISGAISKLNKKILINAKDSYQRQRFTLAHEIGHAVLHFQSDDPNEEFIDFRTTGHRDLKEVEADEFAGCLLMPENLFREAWEKYSQSFEYLSRVFFVSKAAIGVRAFNLGLQ